VPKVTVQTTKLKVFLTEDSLVELQDEYTGKEEDLDKFMSFPIKVLVQQVKMVMRNKQFIAALPPTGSDNKETIKLKDINLEKYTVDSDEKWIPDNLDADDCKPYFFNVGPKTMSRLKTYCQIYQARMSRYNKSLDPEERKIKANRAPLADCFEHVIHEVLIERVMTKLAQLDESEFDKEFDEANNPDKYKKKARTGKKE